MTPALLQEYLNVLNPVFAWVGVVAFWVWLNRL